MRDLLDLNQVGTFIVPTWFNPFLIIEHEIRSGNYFCQLGLTLTIVRIKPSWQI